MQREQVAAKDNDEKLRNETEEASLDSAHCHGSHTLCRKSTIPESQQFAPAKNGRKNGRRSGCPCWVLAYFQGDISRF